MAGDSQSFALGSDFTIITDSYLQNEKGEWVTINRIYGRIDYGR